MPRKFGKTDSNYLSGDDLEIEERPGSYREIVVTINEFKWEQLKRQGGHVDEKWVLYFDRIKKGLVMNATNEKSPVK